MSLPEGGDFLSTKRNAIDVRDVAEMHVRALELKFWASKDVRHPWDNFETTMRQRETTLRQSDNHDNIDLVGHVIERVASDFSFHRFHVGSRPSECVHYCHQGELRAKFWTSYLPFRKVRSSWVKHVVQFIKFPHNFNRNWYFLQHRWLNFIWFFEMISKSARVGTWNFRKWRILIGFRKFFRLSFVRAGILDYPDRRAASQSRYVKWNEFRK